MSTAHPAHPSHRRPVGAERRVSTVVAAGEAAERFDAICAVEEVRPHQLVRAAVANYLAGYDDNPGVDKMISVLRRYRLGISAVPDGNADER